MARLQSHLIVAALAGAAMAIGAADMASADGRGRSLKDAPPRAAPFNWTGFYVGGHIGAAWTDAETTNSANPGPLFGLFQNSGLLPGAIPAEVSHDSTSFTGGVGAGYNVQSGSFVVGVEVDISHLGHDETSSVTTQIGFNPILTTTTETRLDWLGTLRARAGVLATPRTLLYATGGLAFGKVESSTTIVIPAGGCAANAFCSVGSASDTQAGWTIGGGLEHAFARGWSAKIEYLYFDLGDVSYTGHATAAFVAGLPTLDTKTDVDGHILRAGLNFKF